MCRLGAACAIAHLSSLAQIRFGGGVGLGIRSSEERQEELFRVASAHRHDGTLICHAGKSQYRVLAHRGRKSDLAFGARGDHQFTKRGLPHRRWCTFHRCKPAGRSAARLWPQWNANFPITVGMCMNSANRFLLLMPQSASQGRGIPVPSAHLAF